MKWHISLHCSHAAFLFSIVICDDVHCSWKKLNNLSLSLSLSLRLSLSPLLLSHFLSLSLLLCFFFLLILFMHTIMLILSARQMRLCPPSYSCQLQKVWHWDLNLLAISSSCMRSVYSEPVWKKWGCTWQF